MSDEDIFRRAITTGKVNIDGKEYSVKASSHTSILDISGKGY